MYDYSGQFAFHVGLPAKSGVSGALIVVIPNLLGICMWSPPLDETGNTVRGVEFCKEMIEKFKFHNYDTLLHSDAEKFDPRKAVGEGEAEQVVILLFAAKNGDISAIRRWFMQGASLEMADYDGRTALHLAASEGHAELVRFLVDVAKVQPDPKDRWQRTPLDDAKSFGFEECQRILEKAEKEASSLMNKKKTRKSAVNGKDGLAIDESSEEDLYDDEQHHAPAFNPDDPESVLSALSFSASGTMPVHPPKALKGNVTHKDEVIIDAEKLDPKPRTTRVNIS